MWYGTLSFQKIQWCKNNKSTNDDLPLTKNSTCKSKSISTQIYFISNTTCFKYHFKMTLLVVKIIFVNIIFFSIEFGPKLYINIFVSSYTGTLNQSSDSRSIMYATLGYVSQQTLVTSRGLCSSQKDRKEEIL